MTRTVSAAQQIVLDSSIRSLADGWIVQRTDGQTFGFTSHDQNKTVDIAGIGPVLLSAERGIETSAAEHSAAMNVDDQEARGFVHSTTFTVENMLSGLWDNATVYTFKFNWRDPTVVFPIGRGSMGILSEKRNAWSGEKRGMMAALQQPIGRVTSAACDVLQYGDDRCKSTVGIAPTPGTVVSSSANRLFVTDSLDLIANNNYAFGRIVWTGGDNAGLTSEVRVADETNNTIYLFLPAPLPIQAGDTFDAYFGCDRTWEKCVEYGNWLNYQGFRDKPKQDTIIEGPEC